MHLRSRYSTSISLFILTAGSVSGIFYNTYHVEMLVQTVTRKKDQFHSYFLSAYLQNSRVLASDGASMYVYRGLSPSRRVPPVSNVLLCHPVLPHIGFRPTRVLRLCWIPLLIFVERIFSIFILIILIVVP